MKLAGHTMATPELDPFESIKLFASLGLNGIEFVCDEHSGFSIELDIPKRRKIKETAEASGIEIVCLTPYLWDINSENTEIRKAQVETLKRYIQLAEEMGAKYVRVYGGREVSKEKWGKAFSLLVSSLNTAAKIAEDCGIELVVENHPGTMTLTASQTVKLIEAVNHPKVRILYDQANIDYHSSETYEESLAIEGAYISHVHVKDYKLINGERKAVIVGQGIVKWKEILHKLKEIGYNGRLSLEYERKWYPKDLPPAQEGLAMSKSFIEGVLSKTI